jgi:EAL domain-containing protein (putative c-di-GMP-specific phosphodiesterase class I)/GGDEF domain-containing protein
LKLAVAAAVERHQARRQELAGMRRTLQVEQLKIDPLTGLASRHQLMAMLEATAYDAAEANTVAFFIAIDASDTPSVPGELPWEDELALITAERLRRSCDSASAIGRWDVGQFAVLSTDVSDDDVALIERAERIRAVLASDVVCGRETLAVGACVGIARLADRLQWQRLIQQAAGAARDVRDRQGVGLYQVDAPSQGAMHRQLVRALRQALPREEFTLHYQPIVNIDTHGTHAIEALLRWEHDVLGRVSPATFIPVAEQSGDILDIGRWVLWQACQQIGPLLCEGRLRLAVNVSARQVVEERFLPDLQRCLAHHALPPGALEMELTETAMATDIAALRAALEGVRSLGVRISVDDFGTGYSSLSYLSTLPIDTIKVDRSFVNDFVAGGGTIIRAALAMAKEFGKEVIIEGVETQDMLEQVRGLGATLVQGYFFATPMPLPKLVSWLNYAAASDVGDEQEVAT